MGLEHVGFVLGEPYEEIADRYVTFDNGRTVKFHCHSLHDVVAREGRSVNGFHHADR